MLAVSGLRMSGYSTPKDLNKSALLRARVHPSSTGLDGSGVVICVIDYGFDLLHPAFRTRSGETRFAALIDQSGRRLGRAEINQLIRIATRSGDRSAIDSVYDPHRNYFGRDGVQVGAHGSWVASIAGGSRSSEFCGVAPNAMLIGIHLDLPDHAWREEDDEGRPTWIAAAQQGAQALAEWAGWRSYEDSSALVAALEEGDALARSLKPDGIVHNLSVGAWAGGHDSHSRVARAIDRISDTGQLPGNAFTAVVAGTGNAGAEEGHIGQTVTSAGPVQFAWSFAPHAASQSKLEIWSDCPGGITVSLNGRFNGEALSCHFDEPSSSTRAITSSSGEIVGIGENRGGVRNGLSSVRILLNSSSFGPSIVSNADLSFDVEVRPRQDDQAGTVHAWLERDCCHGVTAKLVQTPLKATQTPIVKYSIVDQHRRLCALTPIACGPSVIGVGGLDNAAADDVALAMSGCGPRPWPAPAMRSGTASSNGTASSTGASGSAALLPSPALAAPAHGLFGARSKTDGYMRGSGTSGAAAIVSGATALAIQAATISNQPIDLNYLISILVGANQPPDTLNWRPDLGFGALKFDASSLIETTSTVSRMTNIQQEVMCDERAVPSPN